MNSEPPAPPPDEEPIDLTPEEWAHIRFARAARAMQKSATAARWEDLTPEEKSKLMRTIRLKKIRRKYLLSVIQDHNPDKEYPFTVSVRNPYHSAVFDMEGVDLSHLLQKAAEAICAREEQARGEQ